MTESGWVLNNQGVTGIIESYKEIRRMGNLMEKKLRKQRHLLVEAGTGVILFAIWSVAKVNLYLGLSSFSLDDLYETAAELGINEKFFLVFMGVVVAAILLWHLSTRLYIGLSATAEGKGTPKGYGYLVLAAILLVTDLQSNWQAFGLDRVLAGEKMSMNLITSLCMEAASLYVLLELLISGFRVKQMCKKRKE